MINKENKDYNTIIEAFVFMFENGIDFNIENIKKELYCDEKTPALLTLEHKKDIMFWVNKFKQDEWSGVEEFNHWFKKNRPCKKTELAEYVGIVPTHLSSVLNQNGVPLSKKLKAALIKFRNEHKNL